MRVFILILALATSFGASASNVPTPPEAGNGFENINNRLERSYDQYPNEMIWSEGGRPYWKAAAKKVTKKTITRKTTKRVSKMNRDLDRDGVKNELDQCPNTKTNVVVNSFGCAKGKKVSINLGVKFSSGKSDLDSSYTDQLDRVAKTMKENAHLKIEIQGHTDSTGKYSYNKWISQKRSQAVKNYLTAKHGISGDRLISTGYGPDLPVNENSTAEGRRQNRRVVGKIISN